MSFIHTFHCRFIFSGADSSKLKKRDTFNETRGATEVATRKTLDSIAVKCPHYMQAHEDKRWDNLPWDAGGDGWKANICGKQNLTVQSVDRDGNRRCGLSDVVDRQQLQHLIGSRNEGRYDDVGMCECEELWPQGRDGEDQSWENMRKDFAAPHKGWHMSNTSVYDFLYVS